MSAQTATIVFSHGKESGPWGSKIQAMASAARELGLGVESVDYQGIDDPRVRVEKLLATAGRLTGRLVLAGSSMGGHVSAAAAAQLRPIGLFLLAPAFYMPGFEQYTPRNIPCRTSIIHGWNDEVVPVENSIRWAREHRAALHLLDADHRLQDQIPMITCILTQYLRSIC
jgi:predicted alpha/beta-hydrolase family hydrolase